MIDYYPRYIIVGVHHSSNFAGAVWPKYRLASPPVATYNNIVQLPNFLEISSVMPVPKLSSGVVSTPDLHRGEDLERVET